VVADTLAAAIAAFAAEQWAIGLGLLVAAYEEALLFSAAAASALNNAVACVRTFINSLGGGSGMACATTHKVSSTVQGGGPCCNAYAAAGFPTVAVGQRVVATNKAGKCIVCEVKLSTSKAHPGIPVFKRGKASVPGSTVSCPSTAEGCCALLGQ